MPKPSPVPGRDVAAPAEGERTRRREPGANSAPHESVQPGTRRRFTPADKLRLINAADAAIASGERGALEALLRKERIYSSNLSAWRQQLAAGGQAGLTARKPGRKPKLDAAARALLAVTKENEALKHKLRVATALIALQKKAHEVLGLTLPEPPAEES